MVTLTYEIGTAVRPDDYVRYHATLQKSERGGYVLGPRNLRKLNELRAWRCRVGRADVHYDRDTGEVYFQ